MAEEGILGFGILKTERSKIKILNERGTNNGILGMGILTNIQKRIKTIRK